MGTRSWWLSGAGKLNDGEGPRGSPLPRHQAEAGAGPPRQSCCSPRGRAGSEPWSRPPGLHPLTTTRPPPARRLPAPGGRQPQADRPGSCCASGEIVLLRVNSICCQVRVRTRAFGEGSQETLGLPRSWEDPRQGPPPAPPPSLRERPCDHLGPVVGGAVQRAPGGPRTLARPRGMGGRRTSGCSVCQVRRRRLLVPYLPGS